MMSYFSQNYMNERTMESICELVIFDTPTPLNRLLSMHWAARKRVKGRFNRAVYAAVNNSTLPKEFQAVPKKIHCDTEIYIGSSRGRLLDPDAVMKHLWDSLKDNGVIYDDSQKWFSWSQPVIKRDPKNPRTVLNIKVIRKE